MKDAIKGLIEKLVSLIERDWEEYEEVRCIVMRAYNLYNREENNGYGVIYDITRTKDLEGLTQLSNETIGTLYLNYKLGKATEYFFFENGKKIPTQILTDDLLLMKVKGSLRDVLLAMLENPFYHKEYKELYSITIGDFMEGEQIDRINGWE